MDKESLIKKLIGGVGDKLKERDVDPKQLAIGIKVEQEHVGKNKSMSKEQKDQIAKDIALDHLKEHDGYYTALQKMEKKLEKEGSEGQIGLLEQNLELYPGLIARIKGNLRRRAARRPTIKSMAESRDLATVRRSIRTARLVNNKPGAVLKAMRKFNLSR